MLQSQDACAGVGWGGVGREWGYLSFLIADPPIELLPLQAQEIFPGLDDATLGCDSPGRVDIVSSHHSDCDASTLAFADSFRDLQDTTQVGGASQA